MQPTGDIKEFKAGNHAFLDTFYGGMVPCRVTDVIKVPPIVDVGAPQTEVVGIVTATRGPWPKGHVFTMPWSCVIPPEFYIRPQGLSCGRIRSGFRWVMG